MVELKYWRNKYAVLNASPHTYIFIMAKYNFHIDVHDFNHPQPCPLFLNSKYESHWNIENFGTLNACKNWVEKFNIDNYPCVVPKMACIVIA